MSKVTFAPKAVFGAALFAGALISAKYLNVNNNASEEKVCNTARIGVKTLQQPKEQIDERAVAIASKPVSTSKSMKSAKKNDIEDYDAKASIAIATGRVVSAETLEKKDTAVMSGAFKYYRQLIDDDSEEFSYDVDEKGNLIKRYPDGSEELYENY